MHLELVYKSGGNDDLGGGVCDKGIIAVDPLETGNDVNGEMEEH